MEDPRPKRRLPEDGVGSRSSVATAVSESAALTTMTGAAILGVLAAEAEAARAAQDRGAIPRAPETPSTDGAAHRAPGTDDAHLAPPASPDLRAPAPVESAPTADHRAWLDPAPAPAHETSSQTSVAATSNVSTQGASAPSPPAADAAPALDAPATLDSARTIVSDFGQQVAGTLDSLVADVTAITTLVETSLSHLTSLDGLTAATRTISQGVDQLAQTLTGTTDALADLADTTLDSLSGLTATIGDTGAALLDTLPAAILGGPETPLVDDVFETAFGPQPESGPHPEAPQPAEAPAFLHPLDDLLPFAAETPMVQLGFIGQSYADAVDLHDTSFSTHALHGTY
jgi:hypothetical protein